MLCTDVDGLFTGNPKDAASEFIPTYSPEVICRPQHCAAVLLAPQLPHIAATSRSGSAPARQHNPLI